MSVTCISLGFVNAYAITTPTGWLLVDTGFASSFARIRDTVAKHFGREARPAGIVLTHGHVDHVGAALDLAVYWKVPVYVHEREMPFVQGVLDYPPADVATGGPMSLIARFLSTKGTDLGEWVRPLSQLTLPNGWAIIETPGHTPGHISLWNAETRTLIAGDACATMAFYTWRSILTQAPRLALPNAPFTMDWVNVRRSLRTLAALEPETIYAGHGKPMSGAHVTEKLYELAEWSIFPRTGRYISDPVRVTAEGTLDIPAVPPDPLPKAAKIVGIAVAIGIGYWTYQRYYAKGKE